MKELILVQKQGTTYYKFILTDRYISVYQSTLMRDKTYCIKLEDIGHKTVQEVYSSIRLRILVMVPLMTFSIGLLFLTNEWGWWLYSFFSYLFFSIAVFSNNKLELIGGNVKLELLPDKPNTKTVNEFVIEIIRRSKEIYLYKYGTVDPDLPEEVMIHQLNWLCDLDILPEDELARRIDIYHNLRKTS
jgi:hypothetical protein